ncbi:MAG: hypothetical protein H7281_02755 [Bacteriovorax sp.]|nr:hypothetical protein [Bacteriovorax sp.]
MSAAIDKDSKNIIAPILQINSDDGANVVGEIDVGEAELISIQVLAFLSSLT